MSTTQSRPKRANFVSVKPQQKRSCEQAFFSGAQLYVFPYEFLIRCGYISQCLESNFQADLLKKLKSEIFFSNWLEGFVRYTLSCHSDASEMTSSRAVEGEIMTPCVDILEKVFLWVNVSLLVQQIVKIAPKTLTFKHQKDR